MLLLRKKLKQSPSSFIGIIAIKTNQEAANALVAANRVAAIGFFRDSDSKEAKAYLEVIITMVMTKTMVI